MDKRAIIETLRQHQAELKAAGVAHLRLFGSVARGDHTERSDVDLMAEFDPARRHTLVNLVRIQNMLSDLLGAQVDLTLSSALRDSINNRVRREAVVAF